LGVAPDMKSHPFGRLYQSGVPLSVSSDDPAFFNTNLTREYLRLHQAFDYGAPELAGLALAGLRQSFLPAERRAAEEERFRRQFETLGRELFGEPVVPVTVPV
ncbi:MAG: hypothetical protein M3O15_15705, partial [Acidobacteriota bacterium]|nr:hypothetical protein [Acidobacteriota bacterium]